jgi:hypothetical protein
LRRDFNFVSSIVSAIVFAERVLKARLAQQVFHLRELDPVGVWRRTLRVFKAETIGLARLARLV